MTGRGLNWSRTFLTATPRWLLTLVLSAFVVASTSAQSCLPRKHARGSILEQLAVGDVLETDSLVDFHCHYWTLPKEVIAQDDSCSPSDDGTPLFLLFEFWRLDSKDAVDNRPLENVHFLVARGAQPNVSYTGSDVTYVPPRAPRPQSGSNGTLLDPDADSFWRPYHRVVVSSNATSSRSGNGNWYVTVGNMDQRVAVTRYTIRVSCVAEAAAPCATPSPAKGPCSDNGACGSPPQGMVDRPALNRVCTCDDGWGDYGCQTPADTLPSGVAVTALIEPGAWVFYQLRVPLPEGGVVSYGATKPSLLVEMSRGGGGFGGGGGGGLGAGSGGDPVLVLMPKDSDGSNRVPWFTDITRYADLRSYFLQQNFHYLLSRDLVATTTGAASTGGGRYAEYYVAVYNNDQRFARDPTLLNPRANVTIRARWRVGSSMGSSGSGGGNALCPGDCFGRGTCYDTWDLANPGNLPQPILPPVSPNSAKPADFLCACNTDAGGTMCEGTLRNLSVSTGGDGGRGSLQPGQWYFYIMNFDPRRFDYRGNDVAIQWAVRDASPDPATAYANAFLTIDEHAFPRDAQLDSDDPFRRGWQIFYNSLAQRSNPPQPLQMKGSDLKPGYSYVLGVYNSDYIRQMPFDFTMSVYVPSSSRTWLHPYMSVVLGVTASIILCLLMTLCRRLVQRYGWGPFRPRNPDMPVVQGARVQVAHMPPRQQGVPGHVIDAFHTYEYKATKAEKEHLARNKRDHESAQQQQLQAQASMKLITAASLPGAADGGVEMGALAAAAAPLPYRRSGTGGGGNTVVPAPVPGGGGDGAVSPAIATMAAAAAGEPAPAAAAAAACNQLVVGFAPPPTATTATAANGNGHAHGPTATTAAATAGAAAGGGDFNRPTTAVNDDDEPQCTVCLCEYEEGERITQLPCKHDFHSNCINKWLQTHYTCPICRVSMLPDQPEALDTADQATVDAAVAAAAGGGGGAAAIAGGADGNGSVVVPINPLMSTAEQPAAVAGGSGGGGIMARMLGSMRRAPSQTAAGTNGEQTAAAAAQIHMTRRTGGGGGAGVAESLVLTEPAPAVLQPGGRGSGGAAATVVAAAPAAAPQLVARGPSATLDSPGGLAAAAAGTGTRSPSSQGRLAAGRQGSPQLLGSHTHAQASMEMMEAGELPGVSSPAGR